MFCFPDRRRRDPSSRSGCRIILYDYRRRTERDQGGWDVELLTSCLGGCISCTDCLVGGSGLVGYFRIKQESEVGWADKRDMTYTDDLPAGCTSLSVYFFQ